MKKHVSVNNIVLQLNSKIILKNISFKLSEGEILAVTGPSGSGKSTLGNLLAGNIDPTEGAINKNINHATYIPQQEDFLNVSQQKSAHYSARYEYNNNENWPTVKQYLKSIKSTDPETDKIVSNLKLNSVVNTKLLHLSNGERKRTQIAASLLKNSDLIIFDQPFVGLDTGSKKIVYQVIHYLKKRNKIVVIICNEDDFFVKMDFILELKDGQTVYYLSSPKFKEQSYTGHQYPVNKDAFTDFNISNMGNFTTIAQMNNVNVTVEGKKILNNINWTVKNGEKWALSGDNGAGKTTLLSLISADNPQAYSNNIVLFDNKRGSGESIWDIKKNIGFVSPELHSYFLRGQGINNSIPGLKSKKSIYSKLSCIDVVTSGLKDEVGFSSSDSKNQAEMARKWMNLFNLSHLSESAYLNASLGEQRSLLLARALIKLPPLLILDEPCQGLDKKQTNLFISLLFQINQLINFTLIYVTHNKNEIPGWITRMIVLDKGRIKYAGDIENAKIKLENK